MIKKAIIIGMLCLGYVGADIEAMVPTQQAAGRTATNWFRRYTTQPESSRSWTNPNGWMNRIKNNLNIAYSLLGGNLAFLTGLYGYEAATEQDSINKRNYQQKEQDLKDSTLKDFRGDKIESSDTKLAAKKLHDAAQKAHSSNVDYYKKKAEYLQSMLNTTRGMFYLPNKVTNAELAKYTGYTNMTNNIDAIERQMTNARNIDFTRTKQLERPVNYNPFND